MGKGQVGMGMERVRTGKGLVRDQTGQDGELNNKKSTKKNPQKQQFYSK